jgi:hypothetical protein
MKTPLVYRVIDKLIGPCEFKTVCKFAKDSDDPDRKNMCDTGGGWYCGQYRRQYREKHGE